MTLTQRITTVIQQRKIMQRHLGNGQEQAIPRGRQQRLSQDASSGGRVTIWRGGKRV